MPDQLLDQVGAVEVGVALEGAEADVAVRQPGQHRRARRAGLVAALAAPRRSRSGRTTAEVGTPSASSIAVASTSRTPPFRVSRPSPPRDQGVWPEPLVPRSSSRPGPRLAQLGEQEAAPVAEVGVVDAELVAVVAQRQRLGQVARQRLEPARRRRSIPRRSGRPARRVAAARSLRKRKVALRELGRAHRVGEALAEVEEAGIGPVVRGRGHGPKDQGSRGLGQASSGLRSSARRRVAAAVILVGDQSPAC